MQEPKPAKPTLKKSHVELALGAIGVVAVVVILILLLSGGDSKEGSDSAKGSSGAEIVSVDELREAAGEQKTPVYWVGEQQGTELELSQPSPGRTYVRYLTGGAEAGDRRPNFLTVSTYSQDNAVAALRRQGKEPGGVIGSAPGNATVYFSQTDPQSVYLAYPGVPVEIEVYDPNFKRALQLVNSGQIVAVG
jgi:hypothetical protein